MKNLLSFNYTNPTFARMKEQVQNLSISDFTYRLPNERIAVKPAENRDESKLLVYENVF